MNRYRVTVESISSNAEPLRFEVDNHDDIAAIARKMPSRFGLSEDDTKALVIGLKLFSEIVLKHRNEPPFSEVRPAMREFTRALKQSGVDRTPETAKVPYNSK
jgi:hypothetical protein